jgi:uncharacterized membrane protein
MVKNLNIVKTFRNVTPKSSFTHLEVKMDQMIQAIQEEKTRPAIISQRQWEKNAEEKNKIRRLAGARILKN